ncbi:MAG: FHA domain-containing protein [Planctomycetota bacterium]
MLKAKLKTVGGSETQAEIQLRLPATIGRGRENAVSLNHPLVSRHHCELFEQDGLLVVRDLGSLNGTYIGRDRVEERALYPGDLLTVGSFTFRAIYGDYDESMAVLDDEELEAQTTIDGENLESDAGATSLGSHLKSDVPHVVERTMQVSEADVDTARVGESRTNTTIRTDVKKNKRKSR